MNGAQTSGALRSYFLSAIKFSRVSTDLSGAKKFYKSQNERALSFCYIFFGKYIGDTLMLKKGEIYLIELKQKVEVESGRRKRDRVISLP